VRELVREGRVVRLNVPVPDHPGGLARLTAILAEQGANVLEVFHHRLALNMPAKTASLDLMFEARDRKHAEAVVEAVRAAGFKPTLFPM
jgi:threonine dehydratase